MNVSRPDGTISSGDVIVCRVNGTSNFYVVATVVSGTVGNLSLRGASTVVGQDSALERGYDERLDDRQVWLFDGAAAAFVRTSARKPFRPDPVAR
jgi:hypothetical protein